MSKKRKGYGEYMFPINSKLRYVYKPQQKKFYNALFDFVPEFVEDFNEILIPKFKKVIEECEKEFEETKKTIWITWDSIKTDEKFLEIKKVLNKVKEKHNFYDDWLMEILIEDLIKKTTYNMRDIKLENINENREAKKAKAFFHLSEHYSKTKVSFGPYYWDPIGQTKAEFKKEVIEDIKEKLDVKLKEICSYLEKQGFRKVPVKEDMNKRLILFHVRGFSLMELLDEIGSSINKSTLGESIHKQAKMINLTLRTQV